MTTIFDLDQVVARRVKELEAKFHCMIFVLQDDARTYISVAYLDGRQEVEIPMCERGATKYALASAIRAHFMR